MPFINEVNSQGPEPIAIVGMACRLPGSVDTASKFWQVLREKQSVRTAKVPATRFNIDAHYHPDLSRPGSYSTLGGYFLDENPIDLDPTFFNMTPAEAQWLDPQQRKMLEVCYEVFENAGLSLEDVAGSNTGVYAATFTSDYQQMSIFERDFRHNYAATGVDPGLISSRINNTFNLNGPSSVINTACSSALYAIHNACHALRARDCDAAVAAGSNLIMMVDQQLNTAKLGVLSPTSECHTFDESADGYGRAEGVGAIYLKRLSDAIRDNDVIRGVIRTSAVNTNGKVDGMGITFPNALGQERVLRQAYTRAGLDPDQTAYLECHGTGTPTGDPIEVKAVAKGMNDTRSPDRPLLLGAAKANIGHSEAASGIFATMKAALMTEHGQIPGVHGLKNLNPAIKDKQWNVEIVKDLRAWPEEFDVRRASVSSFGYGGTNAHLVVEAIDSILPGYDKHGTTKSQAAYTYAQESIDRPFLVTMSAHDRKTLARNIEAHQAVATDYYLPDLAHTLNHRRTNFAAARGYTIAWPDRETEAFSTDSFTYGSKISVPGAAATAPVEVGFVFTGQGAQWARMGYEAMHRFPVFNETVSALDRVLKRAVDPKDAPAWSLQQVLEAPAESSRVGQPDVSQPACTAIQIAIVDLLASWGISPTVSVGHSSGEIAAAYAAGRISAPEAILASYFRGLAVARKSPEGTMLAVGLGASKIGDYIDRLPSDVAGRISIACENSPGSATLSGLHEDIEKLRDVVAQDGVFARQLKTGKAYHSSHMDVVAPLYEELYSQAHERLTSADFSWRHNESSMMSSVTGAKNDEEHGGRPLDISYWCDNLRSRVRFDAAVQALGNDEEFKTVKVLTEIGPHSALQGPTKQIMAENEFDLQYVASLIRGQDDAVCLLKTAGELHMRGVDVDLDMVNALNPAPWPRPTIRRRSATKDTIITSTTPRCLVDLPPYQWNYEKQHWYEPRAIADLRTSKFPRHDILGRRIFGLSSKAPAWKNILRCRDVSWFSHHTLGTDVIFPAAGHVSLAIEALLQQLDLEPAEAAGVRLADIDIQKALVVPDTDEGVEVHTRLEQQDGGVDEAAASCWHAFTVESVNKSNGTWTSHSAGRIRLMQSSSSSKAKGPKSAIPYDPMALHQRVAPKRWYRSLDRVGFRYGPEMQTMTGSVRANGSERWASSGIKVQTKMNNNDLESRYMLHPSTIDGCLHVIIAAVHRGQHKEMPWGVIPLTIRDMSIAFPTSSSSSGGSAPGVEDGSCYAWANEDQSSSRHFFGNMQLLSPSSDCLMEIRDLKMVAFESAVPPPTTDPKPKAPYTKVVWKPSDDATEYIKKAAHEATTTTPPVLPEQENGDTSGSSSKTLILVHNNNDDPATTSSAISENLGEGFSSIIVRSLSDVGEKEEKFDSIIIDDANGSILAHATEKTWTSLRTLLLGSSPDKQPLVWVTRGANAGTSPASGLPQGFLRTVRAESPGVSVSLVDADDEVPISSIAALIRHQIAPVMKAVEEVKTDENNDAAAAAAATPPKDVEFWLTGKEDLQVLVPRLEPHDLLNNLLVSGSGVVSRAAEGEKEEGEEEDKQHATETLSAAKSYKGSVIDDQLIWGEEQEAAELGPDEVEIRVQLSTLAKGDISSNAERGGTRFVGGTILRTGSNLDAAVGKYAIAYSDNSRSGDAFHTRIVTPHFAIIDDDYNNKTESSSSSSLVASLPQLVEMVDALGLAVEETTTTTTTTTTQQPKYRNVLVLTEQSSSTSQQESFLSTLATKLGIQITILTAGTTTSVQDFDLVLVTGNPDPETVRDTWNDVPPTCSEFVFGFDTRVESYSPLDMKPLERGVRPRKVGRQPSKAVLEKSLGLLATTTPLYPPTTTTELHQLADSVDAAKKNLSSSSSSGSGSHILRMEYDDTTTTKVKISSSSSSPLHLSAHQQQTQLSPTSAYVLVGCLGGLGRSITTWMFSRGCRNFVFLSRSGASKPEALSLIGRLMSLGASVQVFRVDASDKPAVTKLVRDLSRRLPIKGAVHAAMVLRDGLYENMTFPAYQAALEPKMQGVLALGEALADAGSELDFFLTTSSISAVLGNPGQANYCAANSFLDHFALQRRRGGLPACSIALPAISDVGVVAENQATADALARKMPFSISEKDMLQGFEAAILHGRPTTTTTLGDVQLVLGLDPSVMLQAMNDDDVDVSDAFWYRDARMSTLRTTLETLQKELGGGAAGNNNNGAGVSFISGLKGLPVGGDIIKALAVHIAVRTARILGLDAESFHLDGVSVAKHGVDSMIGVELQRWIFKEFGLQVSITTLSDPVTTFSGLARAVAEHAGLLEAAE